MRNIWQHLDVMWGSRLGAAIAMWFSHDLVMILDILK